MRDREGEIERGVGSGRRGGENRKKQQQKTTKEKKKPTKPPNLTAGNRPLLTSDFN